MSQLRAALPLELLHRGVMYTGEQPSVHRSVDEDMDAATRADVAAWTGCIAGALTRAEDEPSVTATGLVGGEIDETHRVHEHAASAIVRARKPASRA